MGKWISVYLDDKTYKILRDLEEKMDINKCKFVRKAIQERLKKLGLL